MSQQNWEVAETIFSSGASRVTVPDELIEMVQYTIQIIRKLISIYIMTIYTVKKVLIIKHK